MSSIRTIYILGLILTTSMASLGQVERGSMLIKNGTVLTITKGVLENTDVLIKDGKIIRIEKNIVA
ncbi:MAG TPA: amidohydrolase, partial [Cyclobacteriaceae bacterium]|nr:amidohydrolase [Cyclobacteriaceae bacterium]